MKILKMLSNVMKKLVHVWWKPTRWNENVPQNVYVLLEREELVCVWWKSTRGNENVPQNVNILRNQPQNLEFLFFSPRAFWPTLAGPGPFGPPNFGGIIAPQLITDRPSLFVPHFFWARSSNFWSSNDNHYSYSVLLLPLHCFILHSFKLMAINS